MTLDVVEDGVLFFFLFFFVLIQHCRAKTKTMVCIQYVENVVNAAT